MREQAASLATLRRLHHHALNGGKLQALDLARTYGEATPEGIARIIQMIERGQVRQGMSAFPLTIAGC